MSILTEERMTIGEAAKFLGVNACTTWRWMRIGVRGRKLEAIRIGIRWYTSREAIERFTTSNNDEPTVDNKAAKRADATLAANGW